MMQRIILDADGYILSSDDSIFDTSAFRNRSIFLHSPFLESIFRTMLPEQVVSIPRVETLLDNLSGVFDCTFQQQSANTWEWCLYECPCEQLRYEQQLHHEATLRRDTRRF